MWNIILISWSSETTSDVLENAEESTGLQMSLRYILRRLKYSLVSAYYRLLLCEVHFLFDIIYCSMFTACPWAFI